MFVVGPVLVHAAFGSQPPLFVSQVVIPRQVAPLPMYPWLQAQVLVPGPVEVHVALGSHPPLFVPHELMATQTLPLPE